MNAFHAPTSPSPAHMEMLYRVYRPYLDMIPIMCGELFHRPAHLGSTVSCPEPMLKLVPQMDSRPGQMSQCLERQSKPKPSLSGMGKEQIISLNISSRSSTRLGRIPCLPMMCLSLRPLLPPPLCSEPAASHSWKPVSITLQRGASHSSYLFT